MRLTCSLLLLLIAALPATAQRVGVGSYGKAPAEPAHEPDPLTVGIEEKLGAVLPMGLEFRDEHDQPITIGQCVDGKPTILVLAYYRCPKLCNQVLNGLVDSLKKITAFDVGDKYNVLVVSFDPKDKPGIASMKRMNYVQEYYRSGGERGWHFLTGGKEAIDELASTVGFRYEYDKKRKEFNHGSGIMVVTPNGTVSRYFFNIDYNPKELQAAIELSADNRVGPPGDPNQVLMLCFDYNPLTGKYSMSVMKGLRVVAALTVLIIGIWCIRVWRRPRNTLLQPETETVVS